MRSCLSAASSSNDYDNITAGLRAQDVFLGVTALAVAKIKSNFSMDGKLLFDG